MRCNKCNELRKNKKQKRKEARSYRHASHACQQAVPPEIRGAELVGDPLAALSNWLDASMRVIQ
jgi:hypothetical protein